VRRVVRGAAVLGAAALTLAFTGCAPKSAATGATPSTIESTTYAPDLAIDLRQFTRLNSGMYIDDVIEGKGVVAAEGRKATFRYAAYLPDGTVVESQRQPIEAELNENMVKGLRFGMAGMHSGGQRRLIVPPSLAYGGKQYGRVPPNSILVFDVELIAVR
jgi:FKBP-type peptidyl-prolyl cis-trans isomerase